MRTAVAVLALVMGAGIAGIWAMLTVTNQVPEIAAGKRSIWFHLGAELLTSVMLLVSGVLLLTAEAAWVPHYAAAAFGALLYSTVNSPGYYADLRQYGTVAMFVVLAALATGALAYLV